MAQQTPVPKFGNWASDGDVPYTLHFEDVRRRRSGVKAMNPNDPRELHASREDDLRRSPPHHGPVTHKPITESPLHRYGYQLNLGDHRRSGRTSGGSRNSMERSPLHPHYQVQAAARVGVFSPSRGSSEGSHSYASNIAGRLRMRTGGRGDETPEKGCSVPKFGEWDESDPSSADGYSHIFNKVREEKTSSTRATMITDDTIYVNDQDGSSSRSMSCCFAWCKK